VDGLDLQVRAGEMVGLVGPDGAGKTTTMRLLCGALRQNSGVVRVAGYEIPAQVEKAREEIGYLAQRFSLYGDLTVKENLEFFSEVFDMDEADRKQRSQELLRFAGLEEFANRPAAALSGGMQKKLGLACALVHHPKVLLLDEPTGGVDPIARQNSGICSLRYCVKAQQCWLVPHTWMKRCASIVSSLWITAAR